MISGAGAIANNGTDSGVDTWRHQGARHRSQRDNHHLPWRNGSLNPVGLALAEKALAIYQRRAMSEGMPSGSATDDRILIGGMAVRLMIDLGRDIETLASLKVITHCEDSSTIPDRWGLIWWRQKQAIRAGWWLRAGGIEGKQGTVWLPLLQRTENWLRCGAIGPFETATVNEPQRHLLGIGPVQLNDCVQQFCAWAGTSLGPAGRALPSPRHLMKAVAERMAWSPNGDHLLACQASGIDIDRSGASGHYLSVSNRKLATVYRQAMAAPLSGLSLELPEEAPGIPDEQAAPIAMPRFADSAASSSRTKTSLASLRAMLELTNRRLDRRKNIVAEHEALVFRLWLLLASATAMRGIKNIVKSPRMIEPRTGALIICEKKKAHVDGANDASKTLGMNLGSARIVFIPREVRELLVTYHQHLRSLADRKELTPEARQLAIKHAALLDAGEAVPFIGLAKAKGATRAINAEVLPPKWIGQKVRSEFDEGMQSNFARHALRSGLVGQVGQEVIDALLGHWDFGAEPWCNGSALDPMAYRAMSAAIFGAHFGDVAAVMHDA